MDTLFLEPFGGLAGDMLLAALLDLGSDRFRLADLRGLVDELLPGECELELSEVQRGSLRGAHLRVRTPETGTTVHRCLAELSALVEGSPLAPASRGLAQSVLRRLAVAEARVHGIDPEEVHFHEVGAVDTLVDVCGAALALERLGVRRVHASAPYVGGGSVQCAHGELPVPAPATAELLRGIRWTVGVGGERVTPTGAALLAELSDASAHATLPPGFRAEAIGYGAGTREPEAGPPNVVRVQLGSVASEAGLEREVCLIEFNLDDTTGEELGFLVGELRARGAFEVWTSAVQMKKDRPGVVVSVLVRAAGREELVDVALRHSPTLGVRWSAWTRMECEREVLEVRVLGEPVRVKRRMRAFDPDDDPGGAFDLSPEFEDLAAIARTHHIDLRRLEAMAVEAARALVASQRERSDGDAGPA